MRSLGLTSILLASSALAAIPAQAQETPPEDRIEALEHKIEVLQSELEAVKDEQKKPTRASDIKFAPAPTWTSADGKYSFKTRGRIEIDTALFNVREGTRDFNNGTELRRARLGIEGTVERDWLYRLEADFAGASRDDLDNQEVDVKDAFIQYRGFDGFKITAGQHQTPNSLERLTSSNYLTLLEPAAVVEAFTERRNAGGDYKAGFSVGYTGSNWTLTGGVFGDNIAITGAGGADEGYGFHSRATVAPINKDGRLLHLGTSGYWRDTGGRGTVRFGDRPEVRVDGARLVDTGTIAADSYSFVGGEVIGAAGPVFVQGEYDRTDVDRKGATRSLNFDGGYVTVGWFITGETLPYEDGGIGRLKPRQNFSPKSEGWGAFQIAARFSTLNLDDIDIEGGKLDNFTLGLNWYANPYVRVMLNWVRFDTKRRGVETDGDAFATRLAVNW